MEEERRRIEQQQQQRNNVGQRGIDLGGGAGGNAVAGIGGGNMTEEGMRWQMQIQEDVSFKFCFKYICVTIILDKFITLINHLSLLTYTPKNQTNNRFTKKKENQRRNYA
jgi:hypothetical protein